MTDADPQDLVSPEEAQEIVENLMAELVKLRKKRGIGQQPVAKAIGVSQARVSQIENQKGAVNMESVLMYARAIGANLVVVPDEKIAKKKKV